MHYIYLIQNKVNHKIYIGPIKIIKKLSDDNVLEIRNLYKLGNITQKALAEKFNVAVSCISKIVNHVQHKAR